MFNSKTENVILESYSEYFRVFMTRLEVENDTFYDQSVSFCVEVSSPGFGAGAASEPPLIKIRLIIQTVK